MWTADGRNINPRATIFPGKGGGVGPDIMGVETSISDLGVRSRGWGEEV